MAMCTVKRNGILATFFSTLCTIIGFSTPYWLESDGLAPKNKFHNIGLWTICMDMADFKHLYETRFDGCWWIPLEDMFEMRDQLVSPPFFIAVQVLFTICLALALLACLLVFLFAFCLSSDRQVCMLCCISFVMFISALFGTISVIVFGAMGDGRHWMPYPEHNYLSWSFALAVIGSFFAWVAALLFWIEAKRTRRHIEKAEIYAMHGTSKA